MRKGKKVVFGIGLSCLGVCCAGIAIPVWLMLHGSNGLDQSLEAYRAKGLPWLASEVDLKSPPSPAEDAAPLLNRAFAMVDHHITEAGDAVTDAVAGDDKGAKAILDRFGAALDLVTEAAKLPRANFTKDWDFGPEVLFPELAEAKSLVKLLA